MDQPETTPATASPPSELPEDLPGDRTSPLELAIQSEAYERYRQALTTLFAPPLNSPTGVVETSDVPPFTQSLTECLQTAVGLRREFQVARQSIQVVDEGRNHGIHGVISHRGSLLRDRRDVGTSGRCAAGR